MKCFPRRSRRLPVAALKPPFPSPGPPPDPARSCGAEFNYVLKTDYTKISCLQRDRQLRKNFIKTEYWSGIGFLELGMLSRHLRPIAVNMEPRC